MKKRGSGSTRQLPSGKWECIVQSKYTNPDSKTLSPKRIKRTGNTENEAMKKANQALIIWERNFEKNKNNIKIDNKRTFGSYMEEFIEKEVKINLAGSSYKSYIYSMKENFYNYKISKLTLNSLNKVEFEVYYDTITHDKNECSSNLPIQLCKRCCEWLVSDGLLDENYAMQAKTKRKKRDEFFRDKVEREKEQKKIFTNEDIIKFYHAYKNNISQYCAPIILILETMMRGQEVLALNIKDLDFKNNTITVQSAISERFVDNDKSQKLEQYIKVPKNGKSRVIYMTPLAKEVLLFMIEQTRLKCRSNPDGLVFPSYTNHGKIRSLDSFEMMFKELCNKLGIDRDVRKRADGKKVGLSVHALRHTAITIANTSTNANVINTALQAGHTAITTENIYTHTNIDALKTIETFGDSLGYKKENNEKKNTTEELAKLLAEKGIKAEDLIKLLK